MFAFKQFEIDDSHCGMKIGTDGVLLGAWTDISYLSADSTVYDAGAGCGVVSMMIAQRCAAHVTALEIDHDACTDCKCNFAASSASHRLTCIETDFLTITANDRQPDLIVSNPPFFTTGARAPQSARATARHEDSLPMNALIHQSANLLGYGGHLSIVAPADREDEIVFRGTIDGFTPTRLCRVITCEGHAPRRILIELVKGHTERYIEETLTIRNANGQYTPQYTNLVRDFYLNM